MTTWVQSLVNTCYISTILITGTCYWLFRCNDNTSILNHGIRITHKLMSCMYIHTCDHIYFYVPVPHTIMYIIVRIMWPFFRTMWPWPFGSYHVSNAHIITGGYSCLHQVKILIKYKLGNFLLAKLLSLSTYKVVTDTSSDEHQSLCILNKPKWYEIDIFHHNIQSPPNSHSFIVQTLDILGPHDLHSSIRILP